MLCQKESSAKIVTVLKEFELYHDVLHVNDDVSGIHCFLPSFFFLGGAEGGREGERVYMQRKFIN